MAETVPAAERSADTTSAAAKVAAFTVCTLIWGSTFLFISIGNDTVPAFWAATLRLALAAVLLTAIALVRGHAWPRGAALHSAAGYGLLQFGINLPFLYWGEKKVPSGLAAVMYATVPLTTALLARAFGLERLTRAKVLGALLALAGIAVIFSEQLRFAVSPSHLLAILFSVWSACLATILLKRGPRQSPIAANALGAAIGTVVSFFLSALARESHALPSSWASWFPILYLTLAGSVGAFVLWAWLVHRADVTRISYLAVLSPLIALALGVLVRHERMAPASFLGSLLVFAGVSLGLRVAQGPGTARH